MTSLNNLLNVTEFDAEGIKILIDSTDFGFWVQKDLKSEEVWWNEKLYSLLDYKVGEFHPSSNSISRLIISEEQVSFSESIEEKLAESPYITEKFEVKTHLGRSIWLQSNSYYIKDQNGQYSSAYGICYEVVSQDKDSQLGLAAELSASLLHEVNNPLSIVGLSASLIKKIASTQKIEKLLTFTKKIEDSIQEISHTFVDMRLLLGREVPLVTIDLHAEITDCLERFKNVSSKEQIDIHYEGEASEVFIKARPTLLSQVLRSLLTHAFDSAKESDTKSISISLNVEESDVKLSIIDSGNLYKGQSQSELLDWNPRERAHNQNIEASSKYGHSICKQVIQKFNGQLSIDPGDHETQVVVRFPRV